ncbi:MAG: hypothetical protein ACM3US_07270 [Sphingomonadaceae bacterium]
MASRQRNPRGSSSIDALAYYLVVGGATVILYRMALQGSLGTNAQRQAMEVWKALHPGKSYTAASIPAGSGGVASGRGSGSAGVGAAPGNPTRIPTSMVDLGGQPVWWDTQLQTIVQNGPGSNVYKPGDVFVNDNGHHMALQPNGYVEDLTTNETFDIRAFFKAV